MAQYDLTSKMVPYLDRHLVYPLLEFLSLKEIYPEEDILQAKYDLLSKTNMIDTAAELFKQIHHVEEAPTEFTDKRKNVIDTLEGLQSEAGKVLEVIENPDVISALRQDKLQNLQFLRENTTLLLKWSLLFINSVNTNSTVVSMELPLICFTISEFCLLTLR
ncbi:eukaryotic translation initiation factor 3 subunit E [Basidiobolus ranarum]|uniref:Eukaryotic translation initiation factor 3 subunit E n=1 Tax=Basidiobolus ranarum TaxID=34480 RepID=A0ABR2VL02_9FUNG